MSAFTFELVLHRQPSADGCLSYPSQGVEVRAKRADVVGRVVRVIGMDERFRVLRLGRHLGLAVCDECLCGGSELFDAMTRCCNSATPRGSTAGSSLVRHSGLSHANLPVRLNAFSVNLNTSFVGV